jgi:hypothetical protein
MVYTIPLWVIPIAALWLGEPITLARLTGLALGVGRLLLLFNPASFDWSNGSAVLGNRLRRAGDEGGGRRGGVTPYETCGGKDRVALFQNQADSGIGIGSAGTNVATDTCGQDKQLKFSITVCAY